MSNIFTDRLPVGFTVTAHTGAMDTPDNSIESIKAAIASGADVLEFDLNFTEDKRPCLSHNKPIEDESLVYLDEALKLIAEDDKILINIDIKKTDDLASVERAVEKFGLQQRSFMTGIDECFVPAVLEQCTFLKYYLNMNLDGIDTKNENAIDDIIKRVKANNAIGVNFSHKYINKKLVSAVHKAGLLVSAWTANTKDDMIKLINLGVDNITTKKPDELISLIKSEK